MPGVAGTQGGRMAAPLPAPPQKPPRTTRSPHFSERRTGPAPHLSRSGPGHPPGPGGPSPTGGSTSRSGGPSPPKPGPAEGTGLSRAHRGARGSRGGRRRGEPREKKKDPPQKFGCKLPSPPGLPRAPRPYLRGWERAPARRAARTAPRSAAPRRTAGPWPGPVTLGLSQAQLSSARSQREASAAAPRSSR